MRCFIAIDLADKIKDELRKIEIDPSVARVNAPSDYHLTLKFLGEISGGQIERIRRNLSTIRFKPFVLSLAKIGYFPDENRISVAWIGVTPKRKIVKLKEKIDDALLGLLPRDKIFGLHITLYRVTAVRDRTRFKNLLNRDYEGHWKVNSFRLYESRMENGRHIYHVLEEYS